MERLVQPADHVAIAALLRAPNMSKRGEGQPAGSSRQGRLHKHIRTGSVPAGVDGGRAHHLCVPFYLGFADPAREAGGLVAFMLALDEDKGQCTQVVDGPCFRGQSPVRACFDACGVSGRREAPVPTYG